MKSVMKHNFSRVPSADIQRSSFTRTHGHKTTFDAGYLVPIYVDEALPGDTFSLNLSAFARLATPIKPVMDNMFMETFFFAVPNRLVWDNWERLNGEQDNPTDSTDYLVPTVTTAAGFTSNSLYDYFGIPTLVAGLEVNSLHMRAHNLIWNDWFRDQNLQDSLPVPKDDGPDDESLYKLNRRGKRHDYFTSCLPWPQKGPAVTLPLGTSAPVIADGNGQPQFTLAGETRNLVSSAASANTSWNATVTGSGNAVWEDPRLQADLSNATAATINAIREAFQVQRLYERDARGGTRYTEIVKSHFGVVSPDSRLQRPEYLGGGSSPVNMTIVPQTGFSSTDVQTASTPQGNLAAYGTVSATNHSFTKSFTEHCVIIGYACVRADLTYQQGLNRMWSRQSRWDFYWPTLAHLGEQEVLNKEIYADGSAADDQVFGYQERFAEYRYKPSQITGQFRSNFPESLDLWHLSQDFANLPVLGDLFIEENPPIDRVIAVPTEPHFIFDSYIQLNSARPMPVYSVPGLVDHF